MNTIWKFTLPPERDAVVRMPKGATILSVQGQFGEFTAWAVVDPGAEPEARTILILGTGHPVPDGEWDHISTFQMGGGNFVFHAFEKRALRAGERASRADRSVDHQQGDD
jgi:hypothetical protein